MFKRSKTTFNRITDTSDLIKTTVADKLSSVIVTARYGTITIEEYDGGVILPDGTLWDVSNPVLGYATKNGSEQKHLTPLQVKYCEVAYSVGDPTQGDNKPMKIGPRTAAKHMRLYGTRAGEELYGYPRFSEQEVRTFWKSNKQ